MGSGQSTSEDFSSKNTETQMNAVGLDAVERKGSPISVVTQHDLDIFKTVPKKEKSPPFQSGQGETHETFQGHHSFLKRGEKDVERSTFPKKSLISKNSLPSWEHVDQSDIAIPPTVYVGAEVPEDQSNATDEIEPRGKTTKEGPKSQFSKDKDKVKSRKRSRSPQNTPLLLSPMMVNKKSTPRLGSRRGQKEDNEGVPSSTTTRKDKRASSSLLPTPKGTSTTTRDTSYEAKSRKESNMDLPEVPAKPTIYTSVHIPENTNRSKDFLARPSEPLSTKQNPNNSRYVASPISLTNTAIDKKVKCNYVPDEGKGQTTHAFMTNVTKLPSFSKSKGRSPDFLVSPLSSQPAVSPLLSCKHGPVVDMTSGSSHPQNNKRQLLPSFTTPTLRKPEPELPKMPPEPTKLFLKKEVIPEQVLFKKVIVSGSTEEGFQFDVPFNKHRFLRTDTKDRNDQLSMAENTFPTDITTSTSKSVKDDARTSPPMPFEHTEGTTSPPKDYFPFRAVRRLIQNSPLSSFIEIKKKDKSTLERGNVHRKQMAAEEPKKQSELSESHGTAATKMAKDLLFGLSPGKQRNPEGEEKENLQDEFIPPSEAESTSKSYRFKTFEISVQKSPLTSLREKSLSDKVISPVPDVETIRQSSLSLTKQPVRQSYQGKKPLPVYETIPSKFKNKPTGPDVKTLPPPLKFPTMCSGELDVVFTGSSGTAPRVGKAPPPKAQTRSNSHPRKRSPPPFSGNQQLGGEPSPVPESAKLVTSLREVTTLLESAEPRKKADSKSEGMLKDQKSTVPPGDKGVFKSFNSLSLYGFESFSRHQISKKYEPSTADLRPRLKDN